MTENSKACTGHPVPQPLLKSINYLADQGIRKVVFGLYRLNRLSPHLSAKPIEGVFSRVLPAEVFPSSPSFNRHRPKPNRECFAAHSAENWGVWFDPRRSFLPDTALFYLDAVPNQVSTHLPVGGWHVRLIPPPLLERKRGTITKQTFLISSQKHRPNSSIKPII